MKKLKHVVLLDREKVQRAATELNDGYGKGFTLLAFLSAQCRNSDPFNRWGEQALRKFLGWDTRTVKTWLGRLTAGGWIKRTIQPGGLEETEVMLVTDNSDCILWRCGPIQNEKLKKIGVAVKSLMVLATWADPKSLKVANGKQPMAEFVAEKTGLSIPTAKRHIGTLKDAGLLHSYSGRSGRKKNAHDWYLSAKMLKVLPSA